jgi:hypothetical protein
MNKPEAWPKKFFAPLSRSRKKENEPQYCLLKRVLAADYRRFLLHIFLLNKSLCALSA